NIKGTHFQWQTSFNITIPKNRLVAFPGLETSTFANRYIIGQPLTILHLYHALGVDPETGIYQFEDYSGDGSIGGIEDRQWIEDFSPEFYGGLGNTFTYKNLTLSCFFQFKKQKDFNYIRGGASAGIRGNVPAFYVNRWQEPGDDQPIQRANFGRFPGVGIASQNQIQSSAAVSDASFIRLRNVSLSYRLPETWSHGMDLNIYLQGQNLLTITNYKGADPEQSNSAILPPLQQIT